MPYAAFTPLIKAPRSPLLEPAEPQDQPKPKKRGRIWRKAALGVLLGVALLLGIAWRVMFYVPGQSFNKDKLPPLADVGAPAGTGNGVSLSERLRRDVTRLAGEIGPRNLGRRASLVAAAEFVERELLAAGYAVRRQTYQVEG